MSAELLAVFPLWIASVVLILCLLPLTNLLADPSAKPRPQDNPQPVAEADAARPADGVPAAETEA